MGKRGPKPTPTRILKMRGTFRRDRRPKVELTPEPAVPDPPEWLAGDALVEWQRITPELARLGILTKLDLAALAGYCQAWGQWVAAQAKLAAIGPVVKAPSGYPILNPWLTISNKALQQVQRLAAELGLTPSARTRIEVNPAAGRPDTLEVVIGEQNGPTSGG